MRIGGVAWQPIETAPKDELILLYQPNGPLQDEVFMVCQWRVMSPDYGYWSPDGIYGHEWESELKNPTLWVPLDRPRL
jgi:hypothetical protein